MAAEMVTRHTTTNEIQNFRSVALWSSGVPTVGKWLVLQKVFILVLRHVFKRQLETSLKKCFQNQNNSKQAHISLYLVQIPASSFIFIPRKSENSYIFRKRREVQIITINITDNILCIAYIRNRFRNIV